MSTNGKGFGRSNNKKGERKMWIEKIDKNCERCKTIFKGTNNQKLCLKCGFLLVYKNPLMRRKKDE
jgi:rRNA maturation endonuclease Nob1